jgi:RNA polymerase sigma factor for flagellar operon FliA
MVKQHLGLVHHVARRMVPRLSDEVSLDDLVGAGTLGLLQALDSFDERRGLMFSTYAMPRIRGAILDDLRSRDWVPRSVRRKQRRHAAALEAVERLLGRRAGADEVATALDLDPGAYCSWQADLAAGSPVPIDAPAPAGRDAPLAERLADESAAEPGAELERREEIERVKGAIAELPERERTVLSLCYFEELSLKQIARVLRVTESRVSQIRTAALARLRARLAAAA